MDEKKQRIEKRRARINKKTKNKNILGHIGSGASSDYASDSKANHQIAVSNETLDEVKSDGMNIVSSVLIDADAKEQIRKKLENEKHLERLTRVENQISESAETTKLINEKWASIYALDIPQDLKKAIDEQKEAYQAILAKKDKDVTDYRAELKLKDDQYVTKLLRQQEEQIISLLKKMYQQYSRLSTAYKNNLTEIEDAFLEDRNLLLGKHKVVMNSLFEKRRALELLIMESKANREEQFYQELDSLREKDAEDYNKLKMSLEQQLEEMRAIYQTNMEKLNYNFVVLQQREKEDRVTLAQQGQKLARLREKVNKEKSNYLNQDAHFKKENNELTEEYKKVTELFKDLQRKFKLFQNVDKKKYNDLFKMHENEVKKVLDKVLAANKIIHEQILGLKFYPPSDDYFTLEHSVAPIISSQQSSSPPSNETQYNSKFTDSQIRNVLMMIASEASFLAEVKQSVDMDSLSPVEQSLYKVDSIFKSLGIEDREDIEQLCSMFYSDPTSPEPSINPNDSVKILRQFVLKQNYNKGTVTDTSIQPEKSQKKKLKEKEFWDKLTNSLSKQDQTIWNALEEGLKKYNIMLEERKKLVDENESFRRQNQELKALLKTYLSSKVNEELAVPPSKVISLNNN